MTCMFSIYYFWKGYQRDRRYRTVEMTTISCTYTKRTASGRSMGNRPAYTTRVLDNPAPAVTGIIAVGIGGIKAPIRSLDEL